MTAAREEIAQAIEDLSVEDVLWLIDVLHSRAEADRLRALELEDQAKSFQSAAEQLGDGALGLDAFRTVYAAYVAAAEGRRVALRLD